jgi:2-iminobutanoate/2-iminopropanoate deaminase
MRHAMQSAHVAEPSVPRSCIMRHASRNAREEATMPAQEPISTSKANPPYGPYSQGVRWGGLIFTASVSGRRPGQPEPPPDDVRAHAAGALENIRDILEAGGSSLAHVLKVTAYLRDMADYDAMNEVYVRSFTGVLPARSLVMTPTARGPVSFDAIAAVPDA